MLDIFIEINLNISFVTKIRQLLEHLVAHFRKEQSLFINVNHYALDML